MSLGGLARPSNSFILSKDISKEQHPIDNHKFNDTTRMDFEDRRAYEPIEPIHSNNPHCLNTHSTNNTMLPPLTSSANNLNRTFPLTSLPVEPSSISVSKHNNLANTVLVKPGMESSTAKGASPSISLSAAAGPPSNSHDGSKGPGAQKSMLASGPTSKTSLPLSAVFTGTKVRSSRVTKPPPRCLKCMKHFPSRNALFKHIRIHYATRASWEIPVTVIQHDDVDILLGDDPLAQVSVPVNSVFPEHDPLTPSANTSNNITDEHPNVWSNVSSQTPVGRVTPHDDIKAASSQEINTSLREFSPIISPVSMSMTPRSGLDSTFLREPGKEVATPSRETGEGMSNSAPIVINVPSSIHLASVDNPTSSSRTVELVYTGIVTDIRIGHKDATPETALADTGAFVSVMRTSTADLYLPLWRTARKLKASVPPSLRMRMADGTLARPTARIRVPLYIHDHLVWHEFLLHPTLSTNVILGVDFLRKYNARISLGDDPETLELRKLGISIPIKRNNAQPLFANPYNAPVSTLQSSNTTTSIPSSSAAPASSQETLETKSVPANPLHPAQSTEAVPVFTDVALFEFQPRTVHLVPIHLPVAHTWSKLPNLKVLISPYVNKDAPEHLRNLLIANTVVKLRYGKAVIEVVNSNNFSVRVPRDSLILGIAESFDADSLLCKIPVDQMRAVETLSTQDQSRFFNDVYINAVITEHARKQSETPESKSSSSTSSDVSPDISQSSTDSNPDPPLATTYGPYPILSFETLPERGGWKLANGIHIPFSDHLSVDRDMLNNTVGYLSQWPQVFTEDLGRVNLIKHRIDTGDSNPVALPLRRVNPQRMAVISKETEALLSKGVISHSRSPWAAPALLVPKTDGTWRFVIDFSELNKLTTKDSYPLPRIDDAIESLSHSRIFSIMDCTAGFWQIETHPLDRHKAAFLTHDGLYEFNVMPMGLKNSPATFQRMMDTVLSGLQWRFALAYMDDVLVYSKNIEDHFSHMTQVLNRLLEAGLTIKPKKTHVFAPSLRYLGYQIDSQGTRPLPEKIKAIMEIKPPTNVSELRSFLGLTNFYRRFICKFAQIASPLYSLLKESVKWAWTSDCQKAFESLRDAIASSPVLIRPDFSKPFQLATDGSKIGYAGVLSQFDENGREHPILFISRTCTPAELNYGSSELEAAAAIWAIETLHNYIGNTHFTLITDHDSLRWLLTGTKRNRLNRWAVRLQEFDFTIKHRAGRKHSNVDYFSRHPLNENIFPPIDPLDRAPMPTAPDTLLPTLILLVNPTPFVLPLLSLRTFPQLNVNASKMLILYWLYLAILIPFKHVVSVPSLLLLF